jgi:hypothetical protein
LPSSSCSCHTTSTLRQSLLWLLSYQGSLQTYAREPCHKLCCSGACARTLCRAPCMAVEIGDCSSRNERSPKV